MKKLSVTLKLSIGGMALCGLLLYFGAIPLFAGSMRAAYPEFANRFWPWLAFLWGSALPCYGVLSYGWRVADESDGEMLSAEKMPPRCVPLRGWRCLTRFTLPLETSSCSCSV